MAAAVVCDIKKNDQCMSKEIISSHGKYFAALVGTIPGVLIVMLKSNFFETALANLNENYVALVIFYLLLVVLWGGILWLVKHQELPTPLAYVSLAAGTMSSMMGLSATILPLLLAEGGK